MPKEAQRRDQRFNADLPFDGPFLDECRSKMASEKAAMEFHFIRQEHRRLEHVLVELRTLIDVDGELRHTIMNEMPAFYHMVMDAFWRDVVIGTCGLMEDSPIVMDRGASLPAWIDRHMEHQEGMPPEGLDTLLKEVSTQQKVLWPLRSELVAHADRKRVLIQYKKSIPSEMVEASLKALDALIRAIEAHFEIEHLILLPPFGGTDGFLNMIKSRSNSSKSA